LASQTLAVALLATAVVLSPIVARAEDCPPTIPEDCKAYVSNLAAGACLRPGTVFVLNDKWQIAGRSKITERKRLEFFYVVDGTNASKKYAAIFVGIDRVGLQDAHTDIKLTQNKAFKFKSKEEKDIYSRALKHGGQPTQPMRKWSYLPDVGNVFQVEPADAIPQFDFPQAIGDIKHAPHARLYRYATGSISCVPFDAGLNSDVGLVLGKVVDPSKYPVKPLLFQVTVE
jgi:hypothetical protein